MSRVLADLQHRLANLIRVGTVVELDEAAARVRVQAGNITTAWLPWMTTRAGEDRNWWAPEPGEQVLLLAPSGELAQAVVLPSIYQTAHPAPAADRNIHRTTYQDGTVVEYDRTAHKLTASVRGSVEILADTSLTATVGTDATLTAGGSITAEAAGDLSATAGGNITADATGNITASAGGNIDATAVMAVNITAPAIALNGAVTIAGPLSAGPGAGGGGATIQGGMTVTGGDVEADGISLKAHVHTEQGDGADTSAPK